jgi:hypothetical protein
LEPKAAHLVQKLRARAVQLECTLLERVLLEGRPQLRILRRLASILEDEIDSPANLDQFWHDARYKLGKLRRLSQSDRWQIEMLISARIAKPVPVRPSPQPPHPAA